MQGALMGGMGSGRHPDPNSRRSQMRRELEPVSPGVLSVPEAPGDLGVAGSAVWDEAWSTGWAAESDRGAISQLATLEDDRESLRAEIGAAGLTLSRPLQSARGVVIGSEAYSHPGLRELRRIDASILPLRDRLGLSPLARSRLGISVATLAGERSKLEHRQRVDAQMARYRAALKPYERKA